MFKHFIPAEPKRDAAGRVIVVPGSTTLPFGKYKGKTFEYVFEHDKGYCEWVKRKASYGPLLDFKRYIEDREAASHVATPATPPPIPLVRQRNTLGYVDFGRFNGKAFQEVWDANQDYIKWIAGEIEFYGKKFEPRSAQQRDFKQWAISRLAEDRHEKAAAYAAKEKERIRKTQADMKDLNERLKKQREAAARREAERAAALAKAAAERQRMREARAKARAEYETKLNALRAIEKTFMTQEPPVATSADPGKMAVQRLMHVDQEQMAPLSGQRNTPSYQWEKQQEMVPGLKNLFYNKRPRRIATPGDSFICCTTDTNTKKTVWRFPEIAIHCNVNIRLWKMTSTKNIQMVILKVAPARPQIEFLVWEDTTFVLVERANWLNSSAARALAASLKSLVAEPDATRDKNLAPTQRVLTKLWAYFKDGSFGYQHLLSFKAADTALKAGESNQLIDTAVQRVMDKYWLLYVHKHKAPSGGQDPILRALQFKKNRLKFIEFVVDQAGKMGIRS